MNDGWTLGSATAVGIGFGVALAASIGPIGYLVGLATAQGTFLVAREYRRRRP